jgi:hypothetical protein
MAERPTELHAANDEVDALGRVARLVAQGVPSIDNFSAVSDEVGRLFGSDISAIGRSLPPGTERQLAGFTELVATALANAQARDALSRLADEQAGLRRVATLVAKGASPDDLFSAVAEEVAAVIDIPVVGVHR